MHWFASLFVYCFIQVGCFSVIASGRNVGHESKRHRIDDSSTALASVREYPSDLHRCSAVFVTYHWLVTTAKCVYCRGDCNLFVHALSPHITDFPSGEGQNFVIARVIPHPNYERFPQTDDIGLIQLYEPAYSAFIFDLPTQLPMVNGMRGFTYQWEFSIDQRDFYVHQKPVKSMSRALCSVALQQFIDCQYICIQSNQTLTFGSMDEGTAFGVPYDNSTYLFGIYNREGLPFGVQTEVYQSIVPFMPWIRKYTWADTNPFPLDQDPTQAVTTTSTGYPTSRMTVIPSSSFKSTTEANLYTTTTNTTFSPFKSKTTVNPTSATTETTFKPFTSITITTASPTSLATPSTPTSTTPTPTTPTSTTPTPNTPTSTTPTPNTPSVPISSTPPAPTTRTSTASTNPQADLQDDFHLYDRDPFDNNSWRVTAEPQDEEDSTNPFIRPYLSEDSDSTENIDDWSRETGDGLLVGFKTWFPNTWTVAAQGIFAPNEKSELGDVQNTTIPSIESR